MPQISFFQEEVDFTLADKESTIAWISKVINQEGAILEDLNFIFCNDDYLHQINVNYLDHDTYTDIITFDNSEEEGKIEGDIFISVERIEENSHSFNVSFDQELHRVIIHGVLHLIGYNDKTDEEKLLMRKKEEASLSLRK